ncbi:uncharacterized protein LOC116926481 isoform X3 [Daphnia magna]|uniref:uncharacterized protein LOC116926481 isoform X3 n=1 Tax=Daphnia magna TaxID=35525 RepID=UPI001E1BB748|nr:uncharacterized protein LOC116926481 isoform X3 [Daphnia magna]
MTAIDASVSELSSSLVVRRPLSMLLPPSPSSEFALFASASSTSGNHGASQAINASPGGGGTTNGVVVLPTELLLSSPVGTESSALQLVGCYGDHSANHSSEDRRHLVTIGGVGDISRCSSNGSNNNWLADLSVEVCKVETIGEEGSDNSGGGGGGGSGGGECGGGSDDWDESVFFEAAAAAAASCCATGQASHLHHNPHHQHDVGNNLDVLLGNPNLHHSSGGTDLLELDVQNCCTVDFPLSPKQLLLGGSGGGGGGGSSGNSRSSSSISSSSSNSNSSCCPEDGQLIASAGLLSSPPSTPSPSSSGGGGSTRQLQQQQPLPQPPQPCSVSDKMCSKVFTSTSALAKHKLTHSDERRFSCQLCGKAFKRQDHLNGHLITHREKKPFECRADGCGKSYCDARSLRRHQDNHHAPPGSLALAGTIQQAPSPTGLGSSLPSRSASSASSNAGLFISELSGGSPGLVMPTPSAGSTHYPAPGSNGSSTTSSGANSGHFQVNQATENGQQFAGWVTNSAATSGHDSIISLDSRAAQYGSVPPGTANGDRYLPAENQDGHQAQVTWTSAPAESVSPPKGAKKQGTHSAAMKIAEKPNNSKVDGAGTNGKIPSPSMPAAAAAAVVVVKSTKKAKGSKMQQNGKAAAGASSTKNNGNSKKMATDSSTAANNDGLTTQQLELIQEIMRQTQEQHRLMQEEQQLIQHKPAQPSHHTASGPATAKAKKTNNKVKWTSPPPSTANNSDPNQTSGQSTAASNSSAPPGGDPSAANGGVSGRPVECNVCQRRFKNTPALNGHMRLHGGFLKKEAECSGSSGSGNGSGGGGSNGSSGGGGGGSGSGGGSSKKPGESKKDPNTPPLQTASVSVRALIEEKIIQRRNNMAANNPSSSTTPTCPSSASTSVQSVNPPPEASVMLMDVLEEDQRESMDVQSQQPLVPKMEPEGYFEGSLLALSPVSLHRALEGDMDAIPDDDPASNEGGVSSGLHNLHHHHHHSHHGENFFSTSSSSSSALSEVPLLDDSVFHQVSAAAASALLSDISSLDLQSYMDSGNGGGNHNQQQHSQNGVGQYSDLSQYLASSAGDHVNESVVVDSSGMYGHDAASGFQHHSDAGYVSYHHHQHETSVGVVAGLVSAAFGFDPSPSTPLSSLCSPQHYVQHQYQQHSHQPDYTHSSNSVDTCSGGGGYQSMLMPGVDASPYTPSPSPVSPSVTCSSLPHLQRFQPQQQQQQQQQDAVGFYSTSSFSSGGAAHNNAQSNFMIDCANSVLYNMEASGGGGWDHAADLTTVATDALPQLMEQDQPSEQMDHQQQQSSAVLLKPVKVKKSRPSRAKKTNAIDAEAGEVKKRKTMTLTGKKCIKRSDDTDDVLMLGKGNSSAKGDGQFFSAMNLTSSASSAGRHCLMLNPKRNGVGLYWNLVRDKLVSPPQVPSSSASRQKSRVRIGKDHQCAALPRCKKKEANKERESAVLCWSANLAGGKSTELDRLLAWTRSPALPGPKRTEEEVLAVVTHFHGDIQAAKLHLLTQSSSSHHVLNNWTPEEMTVFHAALLQHGKDFPQVAQHLPSKTASQCIQFYYLWKKVCRPHEYASIKRSMVGGSTAAPQSCSPSLMDETSLCDWRDVGCSENDLISLTQPPVVATSAAASQDCSTSSSPSSSSLLLLSPCEFADCHAISSNRATPRRYQGNQSNASPSISLADKLYPCSVCHKVFDKVKSRSAHMKTHKSASMAAAAAAAASSSTTANGQDNCSSLVSNKNRKSHHHHHHHVHHHHKSPSLAGGALTPASPVSTTSHSSLSSTSCSLPSPYLPSQSLF